MRPAADPLARLLADAARGRPLPALVIVSSSEDLLSLEAQDAIRAAARQQGYTEREVLQADARFDWSRLAAAAQAQSLFGDRKLIEVRLPSGKPGTAGAATLEQHAARLDDSAMTMLVLPKLDRRAREARWAAALERAGQWIEIGNIDRATLPDWIAERLSRQQQRADPEALQFLAERVEGNLLAAHQEIEKLALLYPPGALTLENVAESVSRVARYDVFQLPVAMLSGDGARIVRTVDGLRAEGEAVPLVLWTVAEELRTMLRVRTAVDGGRPFATVARENRLWGPRERLAERALARVSTDQLAKGLERAADVDRLAKGLRPPAIDSDPWLELTDLALMFAR